MNAQTPGPSYVGGLRPSSVHVMHPDRIGALCECHWYGIDDPTEEQANQLRANARLLSSAFNAFDRAGRELGIDASTLAESLDLAALIRAAWAVQSVAATHGRYSERIDATEYAATIAPMIRAAKLPESIG